MNIDIPPILKKNKKESPTFRIITPNSFLMQIKSKKPGA